MEERIVQFISALRSAGLRISLAETEDAFQAVERMGVSDRNSFRLSLRATLVKDQEGLPVFDELFPLFFGAAGQPPMLPLGDEMSPEEAEILAQALRQFSERLRQTLERLLQGERLSAEELERLARLVGLNQADDWRYREWMTQRMLKALRFSEVRRAMAELAALLAELGMNRQRLDQVRNLLQANQRALEEQVRQFTGQRIAQNTAHRPPQESAADLLNRHFGALSERDMERLRGEVRRLAAILRTRVALRQKKAKSGQLDAKATLRANLKHGGVPMQIKHRQRALKPRLVVLCDVSTSMRFCSELMLSLLYALQDLVHKTFAFAFIDHLEYISPDLSGREVSAAVARVLERMPSGYYNTDLGASLDDFTHTHLEMADSRTTFIIVSDGRNNYNDPRLELFRAIVRRCRRAIWINPEAPALWGTGDSDMHRYALECDDILQVNSLADLTLAVDRLLNRQ
ncbi:MAG: VWA domain-containing protein [Anaerolineales bacterium]|nr:VWA domain-containing protein [Anaerolineales bacterium]